MLRHELPRGMTAMAPKVVGRSLVESVQTPFVPKTHADAGLFLLLKAAELCRE